MSDRYPALTFLPNVDWKHVNPALWDGLNSVLTGLGKNGTVISGYRSNTHSRAVGGFAGDPHTRGIAADVLVNGQPIGLVPGIIPMLASNGIESGNQPNFYKGKPDPAHVQLGTSSVPAPNADLPEGSTVTNTLAPTNLPTGSGCSSMILLGLIMFTLLGELTWLGFVLF